MQWRNIFIVPISMALCLELIRHRIIVPFVNCMDIFNVMYFDESVAFFFFVFRYQKCWSFVSVFLKHSSHFLAWLWFDAAMWAQYADGRDNNRTLIKWNMFNFVYVFIFFFFFIFMLWNIFGRCDASGIENCYICGKWKKVANFLGLRTM